MSLVCTILTVILVVARPALGYAAATWTSKEGPWTLCFAAPLRRQTKVDELESRKELEWIGFYVFLKAALQGEKKKSARNV